jgi:oxygen-independent coproporphyrinogen-3 oxidase
MSSYVDTLIREIRATAVTCANTAALRARRGRVFSDTVPEPLQTVYLGGGTPSLLPVPLLGRVLEEIELCFGIATDAEVTLEADPATFTTQSLDAMHALGINRLSIGVQAFQNDLLTGAGRTHSAEDAHAAVAAVAASRFQANWSLDLLFGLPNQAATDWSESIAFAVGAAPTHISTYGLTVEPGSTWGLRGYEEDAAPLPREEAVAEMYEAMHSRLTVAGYEHYEVSNFAKPGMESQHNQVYWGGLPFWGFGVGATSCDTSLRVRRPRSIASWTRWVDELDDRTVQLSSNVETRSKSSVSRSAAIAKASGLQVEDVQPVDAVIAGLRTARGVSFHSLRNVAVEAAAGRGTCTGRSAGTYVHSEANAMTPVRRGRRRTGVDPLERVWPLLLALQEQGLVELHVDQREDGLCSDENRVTMQPAAALHGSVGERLLPAADGWAQPVQGHVRLTASRGFLLADGITAEIWSALEKQESHG